MLLGVIASGRAVLAAPGPSVPAGARGVLDFVNEFYSFDSVTYTGADVIDTPSAVLAGCGLVILDQFAAGVYSVKMLAPFSTFVLAGDWTLVFEYYCVTNNYTSMQLFISPATTPCIIEQVAGFVDFDEANGGNSRNIDTSITEIVARSKVAIAATNNSAHIAMKLQGGSDGGIVTSGAQPSFVGADTYIGSRSTGSGGAGVLGRIIFYDSQPDGDLSGLAVSTTLHLPAVNDNFSNAISLSVGVPSTSFNYMATSEGAEPNPDGNNGGATIWWRFTAPATQSYTIDLTASPDNAFGITVAVFTGSVVNALSLVANTAAYPAPTLMFSATSGVVYHIQVDGWGGGEGPLTIEVN